MRHVHGQAAIRRALALALAGLALGLSVLTAFHKELPPLPQKAGIFFLRTALYPHLPERARPALSPLNRLVVQQSPLLAQVKLPPETPPVAPPPLPPESSCETLEEAPETPLPAPEADNGVTPRTIHPTNPAGYLVWRDVYIKNTSCHAPDLAALMKTPPAARFRAESAPQVLILHTHGNEAYTLPEGQSYISTGRSRTADTRYNVVRVGDEIAAVFEEAGISVLHDRTLHDAESYNDSYAHAARAIEKYLADYPSIQFVLDVHRDAIESKDGTVYKVVSEVEGRRAAQVSLVLGTDGSGLPHDRWAENLKLGVLLQQRVTERYPTLMRPMYLRNSRYNEHATCGSLLVEVGAAGNSLEEALYAARLFAAEAAAVFKGLA